MKRQVSQTNKQTAQKKFDAVHGIGTVYACDAKETGVCVCACVCGRHSYSDTPLTWAIDRENDTLFFSSAGVAGPPGVFSADRSGGFGNGTAFTPFGVFDLDFGVAFFLDFLEGAEEGGVLSLAAVCGDLVVVYKKHTYRKMKQICR